MCAVPLRPSPCGRPTLSSRETERPEESASGRIHRGGGGGGGTGTRGGGERADNRAVGGAADDGEALGWRQGVSNPCAEVAPALVASGRVDAGWQWRVCFGAAELADGKMRVDSGRQVSRSSAGH